MTTLKPTHRVITIVSLILLSHYPNVTAQDIQATYEFKEPVFLSECDDAGTVAAGTLADLINKGIRFTVRKKKDDNNFIIQVITFSNNENLNKQLVYKTVTTKTEKRFLRKDKTIIDKSASTRKNYLISKTDLLGKATPLPDIEIGGSFVVGVMVTPIKMRFGSSDKSLNRYFNLTSDVNLGVTVGHKQTWMHNNKPFSFAFLSGVSIGSIPMDSTNSQGTITTPTNVAALTIPASIVFFKNNFQIGITVGYDIVTGEVGKKWIYRNSPWLGVGLGYNLFQTNEVNKKANYEN